MVVSRVIMVLALSVLAYLLYNTISTNESKPENMTNMKSKTVITGQETFVSEPAPVVEQKQEIPETTEEINYEHFEVVGAVGDQESGPAEAPVSSGDAVVDDNDVLQIEGTDLLATPLADRFQAVNSIANVNRNASNDLRGDIAIQYDDGYTPFYQSHIHGEPLHANPLQ